MIIIIKVIYLVINNLYIYLFIIKYYIDESREFSSIK